MKKPIKTALRFVSPFQNAIKMKKIYIVDDIKQTRENYGKMLKDIKNCEISTFHNKTKLFDVLRKSEAPDLITMDMFFDDANTKDGTYTGLEVIEEIRLKYPNLSSKFLIVTFSHNDLTLVDRAYRLGCKGYLVKDNNIRKLLPRTVNKVLNGNSRFSISSEIRSRWIPVTRKDDLVENLKNLPHPCWEIFVDMAKGEDVNKIKNKFGDNNFPTKTSQIRAVLGLAGGNNHQIPLMAFKLGIKEVINHYNVQIPHDDAPDIESI